MRREIIKIIKKKQVKYEIIYDINLYHDLTYKGSLSLCTEESYSAQSIDVLYTSGQQSQ